MTSEKYSACRSGLTECTEAERECRGVAREAESGELFFEEDESGWSLRRYCDSAAGGER
jgi:hypothetical protein